MEIKPLDETKKEVLSKIVDLVNSIMGYIDLYESNRPASIAITKLEESVMWCQVMVQNVSLKPEIIEKIESSKETVIEADAIEVIDAA